MLSIRPFCVTTDMPEVYKWLEQQAGLSFDREESPRSELQQSYIDILQSNYSQALVCLLDHRPICQLDIGRAVFNEVFMYTDTAEGDYSFRMIMSPYATVRDAYVDVIGVFLRYFFSFEHVRRVLTYLPVYDEWSNHLLKNAGFAYLDTRRTLYGAVNLYECAGFSEPAKAYIQKNP